MASVLSATVSKLSSVFQTDKQSHLTANTNQTNVAKKTKANSQKLGVPGKLALGQTASSRAATQPNNNFLKVPGKTLVPTPSSQTLGSILAKRNPNPNSPRDNRIQSTEVDKIVDIDPLAKARPTDPLLDDHTSTRELMRAPPLGLASTGDASTAQKELIKKKQRDRHCTVSFSVPNMCCCPCFDLEIDDRSHDSKGKAPRSVDSKGKTSQRTRKLTVIETKVIRSKRRLKKIRLRCCKPHVPSWWRSDTPHFDWQDINMGIEPTITKPIRKKARTIFRLLERMNVTREIGAKTFSVMFRMYPNTIAYMVSTHREINSFEHLPALVPLAPPKQSLSQSGDSSSPVDDNFKCLVFNVHEISYFTPQTLRHSFLKDDELKQFTPLLTHFGAVTASLVYIVNVMHDEKEVMGFMDELSRIHSTIPGIDAFYFRTMMESIDQGLLALMGKDIYKGDYRRAMIKVLEWIYYHMSRDMADDHTSY